MRDPNPDDVPLCCTRAVHDSVAGWWCPAHGDEMQMCIDEAAQGAGADGHAAGLTS
jgi:hypothetical protein